MSEPLQIKVDRARSTCPYCKGEVTGGHVWLCPACAAPHHTECMSEHGACATCGHRATAAAKPATDARFARFRAAISSLGFAILREGERDVLALHPAWQGQAHLVHVVMTEALTQHQVEADLARLARDPLAQGNATLLHVPTGRVEQAAVEWIRTSSSGKTRDRFACVPIASTAAGLVTPQAWLGEGFPLHAELATRIVEQGASLAGQAQPPPPEPVAVHARPRPPTSSLGPLPEPTASGESAGAMQVIIAALVALGVGLLLLIAISAMTT